MKKQTKTDAERLTEGLLAARAELQEEAGEDDKERDFEAPKEIAEQFAALTEADIRKQIADAKALGLTAVIQLGFAYMGLRTKLRGRFKKTIEAEEGKKGYLSAWRAVCRAKAFLLLPEVAGELGRRAVARVISLTPEDLLALRAKLLGSPPEVAKSVTEELLDKIDDQRRAEKARNAAGRRRPRKEIEVEIPDLDFKLSSLVVDANRTLWEIFDHPIDPKHKDQALKAVRLLSVAWDRASYNLSDPEHKTKPRWEMDAHERALDGIGDDAEAAS